MDNARKIAVKALGSVEKDGAYSNITLNKILSASDLQGSERALAAALFYGVLDRKITLDFVLGKFLTKSVSRVSPYTLSVLRTALFQIMYMEKIPNSAAVNEAVKLVKSSKERYNAAFVNGVLRNIIRQGIELPNSNSVFDLSVRYSCPRNIIESFVADYGITDAVGILEESLKTPPLVLQVNTLKTTVTELSQLLQADGISVLKTDDNSITVSGGIDISKNKYFCDGFFYVQDNASRRAISKLEIKKGERVLDLCAAPGGKSFAAACDLKNSGEIYSFDIYEKRVALIKQGAERLGFDNIKALVGDALVYKGEIGPFDKVICDVPCSGLGVIRRKPEIKYKSNEEWDSLPDLQYKILQNAALYTRSGGKILYSTCTLRKAENQEVTNLFIDNNSDFKLKYEHTFMPNIDGTDGFYCALLEKG